MAEKAVAETEPQYAIDLSRLPYDKRMLVAQTFTWLKTHFPEFNEMIYEIQRGQREGKLGVIDVRADNYTGYNAKDDTLTLSFAPAYYLGIDNQIYQRSLNEMLIHQLEYAVQKTKPGYEAEQAKLDKVGAEVDAAHEALKHFLWGKGANNWREYPYFNFLSGGVRPREAWELQDAILQDPEFKRLGQAWLDAEIAYNKAAAPLEKGAMGRANILSQLLGKARRGTGLDGGITGEYTDSLTNPLLVYTDSPADIRKQEHTTWHLRYETPMPPMLHGEAGVLKGHAYNLQDDWGNLVNADTKNITDEEWQLIQDVKGRLLTPEILATITDDEKAKIDRIIDAMKADFNRTLGNDPLSTVTERVLVAHGVDGVADAARKKKTSFSIEERDALNRQNADFDHYEYYSFAGFIPVRFLVDKNGYKYDAESIGEEKGTLARDRYRLSRFHDNYANAEFDEIDETEFRRLVENYEHHEPRRSPEAKRFGQDQMLRLPKGR